MLLTRRWMGPTEAEVTKPAQPEIEGRGKQQEAAVASASVKDPQHSAVKGQSNPVKRKRKKRKAKELQARASKDPEVAAAYLKAWSQARPDVNRREPPAAHNSEPIWRFNKATQAWLLRYAFEPKQVPKTVFQLLLRYLEGLQGAARERLRSEAEAVVVLGGAPLANGRGGPADGPVSEDGPPKAAEPRKKRRAGQDQGRDEASAKAMDSAPAIEGSQEGDDAIAADPALDKAEARARRVRLRRAKSVQQVLDGGAGDDED